MANTEHGVNVWMRVGDGNEHHVGTAGSSAVIPDLLREVADYMEFISGRSQPENAYQGHTSGDVK